MGHPASVLITTVIKGTRADAACLLGKTVLSLFLVEEAVGFQRLRMRSFVLKVAALKLPIQPPLPLGPEAAFGIATQSLD